MFNSKGRATAQLQTFSGTVALADPENLPEGASPRCQNCDFLVGSVTSRGGMVNEFSFSGSGAGPNGGGSAVDEGGTNAWSSPSNILLNDGSYASVAISAGAGSLTATHISITNGLVSGIGLLCVVNFTFSATPPPIQPGQLYAFSDIAPSPYTEFNGNSYAPYSISGSVVTFHFAYGTYSNTPFGGAALTSGTASVSPAIEPSNVLQVTQFAFSIPVAQQIAGTTVDLKGYSTASQTATLWLVSGGAQVGNAKTLILTGSVTTLAFGGPTDSWGAALMAATINPTTFGVAIQINGAGTAYLDYVSITVSTTPASTNFDYIGTFEDSFGNIRNIALDALGDFYIEDPINNPKVLTALTGIEGVPANSFVSAFTADSRQFMAISDLLRGNYPPTAYNTQWSDRISQVGPGAAPAFTGTLQPSANAPITGYSASGGVLTLTAANAFTAGEVVVIVAGAADALFPINGQRFNVLGTGLSGTQFEISTSAITGSGTSTAVATGQYTYPIAASPNGIKQYPFWNSAQGYQSGLDGILWSAGPGSTESGNVITIYYLQGSHGLPDANLVAAFQAQKFPVYVYVSGTNQPIANGTQLVTSVGVGKPPGAAATRWYFTFNVAQSGYQLLGGGANSQVGTYQLTVATMTSLLPLPGVQTGDDITISGDSVTSWNQTWPIVNALNSGTYTISQTSMTSGVATYDWALSGATGSAPVAGQLVTVSGCLNGNGVFNVTDAVIASVTGTSSGTFTISGFVSPDFGAQAETGQATTSGTIFQIDPGPLTLGNAADNPIYGNSGGGYVTLVGSTSLVVAAGVREGTCFFITRNGYWTRCAAPVQFTTTENTNYILCSAIPIGPPDTVARAIVFTEAGSGAPGASYYTIPEPVSFVYNGVKYLSSSLFINDNTTTIAQFTFSDSVLLAATEVDIQGNDVFNLAELGDSAWCTQYAGRSVFGRVNNKIQNFVNLSFDGGYLPNPNGNLLPLGWALDQATSPDGSPPTLLNSPIFGNSYYIKNLTGSAAAALGRITQTAFQDWNNVAILLINTAYSVRVTCRTPGSSASGSLQIDLTEFNTASGYGKTWGSYSLNCTAMTSAMATYTGTLLTTGFASVPSDLYLRIWAENLPNNGDIEIDRIEVYPTLAPQNLTGLSISYKNDWESFDLVTGGTDTSTVNAQPANGGFVMDNRLYILKESSMGYLSDTPNQEPADWNPYREISPTAGAAGIFAWDSGPRWAVMACQNGLYMFNGGEPVQVQLENDQIWQQINWDYGHTIVARNDIPNKRILVAVPMVTPNQWCPDFAANANPTAPNVLILLSYQGIPTFEQLVSDEPLHVTLMGQLAVHDLRRKWSLWSFVSPYFAIVKRDELTGQMLFCNGSNTSKIYAQGSYKVPSDDGAPFPKSYCTYGFVSTAQGQQNPMLGEWNKRYAMWDLLIRGSGHPSLTFYQNTLNAPYPFVVPGGLTLTDPAANDLQGPLDEYATRMFVEIRANDATTYFSLARVTLAGQQDFWAPVRGF